MVTFFQIGSPVYSSSIGYRSLILKAVLIRLSIYLLISEGTLALVNEAGKDQPIQTSDFALVNPMKSTITTTGATNPSR